MHCFKEKMSVHAKMTGSNITLIQPMMVKHVKGKKSLKKSHYQKGTWLHCLTKKGEKICDL